MEEERWSLTKKLFEEALELEGMEREAFLTDACGEDDALADEVRSLLSALEDSKGFLEVTEAGPIESHDADGARLHG